MNLTEPNWSFLFSDCRSRNFEATNITMKYSYAVLVHRPPTCDGGWRMMHERFLLRLKEIKTDS